MREKGKILNQLSNYQLLRKASAPWGKSVACWINQSAVDGLFEPTIVRSASFSSPRQIFNELGQ